jgi:2-polyprenyl-3-methyl-5-hydroxy-6-metoxy-1,4-benzoquinol methylase
VRAALAAAVGTYDGQPRGVRLHVQGRVRSCPFDALEARVPTAGRVLDVGCGHGVLSILLAQASPERTVLGVDVDAGKVAAAEMAASRSGLANVSFRNVDDDWEPDDQWDAIVLADVLYLLGATRARDLLASLGACLAPSGVLLVKEIDVRPRWKFELARVQELVATRVARVTEGDRVEFVPPAVIADTLVAAGLTVEHVPLQKGRLHPHHLVVGRRA